jgi:hypothetical protein
MATSGTTTFKSTLDDIVNDAFQLINVYGQDVNIPDEDFRYAKRLLNRMIKAWQVQGYHLWLKEAVFMFTAINQIEYSLKTGGDHVTSKYYKANLIAAASAGAAFISVDDVSNIQLGDEMGVMLDTNGLFWSTVDSIVSNDVYFGGGDVLPSSAASGKIIYNYRLRVEQPFNVWSAQRRTESEEDIPMNYLSFEEYQQQPSKRAPSIPVSYNYDRQRDSAVIRLWPAPQTAKLIILLTIYRKIQDYDVNSNTSDLPQEWEDAIVFNLAERLSFKYRKNTGDLYVSLAQKAASLLAVAQAFDDEPGSVYIQPDRHMRY